MIKHDYNPEKYKELTPSPILSRLPGWVAHPFLIIGMAACILMLAFTLSEPKHINPESPTLVETMIKPHENTQVYEAPINIPLEISAPPRPQPILTNTSEKEWKAEAVRKGDNLSIIFKRIGLSPQLLHKVITLDENTKLLKKLKPGEVIAYQLNKNKQLTALKYAINLQKTLIITLKNNILSSLIVNKTIEYRTAYAYGNIEGSLFSAGKKAGLTDNQVMQLANIFDWDIDFILDIRKGDSFSMLYLEKFMEGEKIGNGEILAAEFINQGKSYRAVQYTDVNDKTDYYAPSGISMRKAFLRAPLKFSYISSNFKPKRFHPILKRWKAHRGIDYRARTGTPIRAAGSGRVIASGYSKYNGKYVFIQHGNGIVTKYLHMSHRAVSKNKKVRQGQVIGYVGATGLAEAPHLHYEFVVNGVHRNPRTVKLPQANPVPNSERSRFALRTTPWLNQLASRNLMNNSYAQVSP